MDYFIKASAVIAIFYICFHLFLKKETFFNHNRWFLLIGLVIALVFPLIVIPIYIPIEPITVTETPNLLYESTVNTSINETETTFDWQNLIPIIYTLGVFILFTQFILQFGSLILLLIRNPKNKDGIYTYVIVENKISPFSFFKWIVYNPENYNSEELELILIHEKVHANQIHSLDILFSQLVSVIFWFNPLIWLYRKEVRQNLEYIADYETQTSSQIEKNYQRLLLKTSVAHHKVSLSNSFNNSSIKNRIVMLKKSRSNRTKQLRYLLILPLLAGLLLSMNTKEVYVEGEASTLNSKTVLEFVVTKNTTDNDLKSMTKAVEEKGGSLVFSNVQRNKDNELTNIFVKLYNHSYGGGNSKNTIEPFIIYKELYGDRGGYVGRINGATLHFDTTKSASASVTQISSLQKRAHNAIIKSGIQTKEDLKAFKKLQTNNKNKVPNKKNKSLKSKKKTSTIEDKMIATTTSKKKKTKLHSTRDTSIAIIDKNTSDSELDRIKESLKKEGLTVKFRGVKRNDRGEITSIKINAKSKKSSASYNISSDDEVIEPIKIIFSEDTNSISIGKGHTKHNENTFILETEDDGTHKIHKSTNGSKVIVISDDEHEQHNEIIVRGYGENGKVKTIKQSKNIQVISGEDDLIEVIIEEEEEENNNQDKKVIMVKGFSRNNSEEQDTILIRGKAKNIWVNKDSDSIWVNKDHNKKEDIIILQNAYDDDNVFISTNSDKDPLVIIDGKEASKEDFRDLDTDKIESINVLKGKKAEKMYGKKGKDDVIVIKTKKN